MNVKLDKKSEALLKEMLRQNSRYGPLDLMLNEAVGVFYASERKKGFRWIMNGKSTAFQEAHWSRDSFVYKGFSAYWYEDHAAEYFWFEPKLAETKYSSLIAVAIICLLLSLDNLAFSPLF